MMCDTMNTETKTLISLAVVAIFAMTAFAALLPSADAADDTVTVQKYWTFSPTFISTATDAADISWDFGDSTTVLDSRQSATDSYAALLAANGGNVWQPRHTYEAVGKYTVTQTVYNTYTDTDGSQKTGTDSTSITIEIMGDPVVTFSTGDGASVIDPVSVPKTIGTSVYTANPVAAPAEPTRSGYTFIGWYTDAACTDRYDFGTPVTESMTLYAKWSSGSGAGFEKFTEDAKQWISEHALTFGLIVAAVIALLACVITRNPYVMAIAVVLAILAVCAYTLNWSIKL